MPRPPAIIGSRDLAKTGRRDLVESDEDFRFDDFDNATPYEVPKRFPGETAANYRQRLLEEATRLSAIRKPLQARKTLLIDDYYDYSVEERGRLHDQIGYIMQAQTVLIYEIGKLPSPPLRHEPPKRDYWGDAAYICAELAALAGPLMSVVAALFAIAGGVYLIVILNHFTDQHNAAVEAERHPDPATTFDNSGAHTLKLTTNSDGSYITDCRIGNATFRCMMDTGSAMGPRVTIAIDNKTARRAGIDVSHLNYNASLTTPVGEEAAAVVPIDSLRVGPFVVKKTYAMVSRGDEEINTVTSGFMSHYHITMHGNTMTITE